MTIIKIFKEREALSESGRIYVNAVKMYMISREYLLDREASNSGEQIDLVFKRPNTDGDLITIVECKNTKTSPFRKDFALEILGYLSYVLLHSTQRFQFKIFVKQMSNEQKWNEIFGSSYSDENIENYLSEFLPLMTKRKIDITNKRIIESAITDKRIYTFFNTTEVYEVDTESLVTSSKEEFSPFDDFISKYASEINKKWLKRAKPCKIPSYLFSNLFTIDFPRRIYAAPLTVEKDQIREILGKSWRPPFVLYSKRLFTFSKITDSNPLNLMIDPSSILEYETRSFLENEERQRILQILLNSCLNYIGYQKRLRRDGKRRFFFISDSEDEKYIKERAIPWSRNRKGKSVITPYFLKDGRLNFVYHRGCLARCEFYNEIPYYKLLPTKLFSFDGKELCDPKISVKIEHKFRKPVMSYNPNLRNELNFWIEVFFTPSTIPLFSSYSKPTPLPKIGQNRSIKFPYLPIKYEDQSRDQNIPLKEFFGGNK